MMSEPICREIDENSDYLLLPPGVYSVNCGERTDSLEFSGKLTCLESCSCINSCFCGILLPYFIHNMNNLLVGVAGNIDLAGMFMPDLKKVEPKISSARTATGSLVEYVRDLAGTLSVDSGNCLSNDSLKKTMILLRAACGRSVTTEGTENMKIQQPLQVTDASAVLTVLNGMVTWCVIALGGSGSIHGRIEGSVISFCWRKPGGAGLPQMPGEKHITSIISMAGGLARRAGCALVVENWTEKSGKVSLVIK